MFMVVLVWLWPNRPDTVRTSAPFLINNVALVCRRLCRLTFGRPLRFSNFCNS